MVFVTDKWRKLTSKQNILTLTRVSTTKIGTNTCEQNIKCSVIFLEGRVKRADNKRKPKKHCWERNYVLPLFHK